MKGFFVFALAGVLCLLMGLSAVAERPAPDPLRAIAVSAKEAQHDAALYQWARVNRHVDRIVGDLHKVERLLAQDPARQSFLQELNSAVRSLREARLQRDRLRIMESAQRVEKLTSE
jgi:hypothetical protein